MAAAVYESMTGNNKALVAAFVVLKLVDINTTWMEAANEEEQSEEDLLLESMAWARAYAATNLSNRVNDAASKAAALTKNMFDVLQSRAAGHMLHGEGAEQLLADFEEAYLDAYGAPMVVVTVPLYTLSRKTSSTRGTHSSGNNTRALAVVSLLLNSPLKDDSLAAYISCLTADCLRQCLPALPPDAGAGDKDWLSLLKFQGPFWEGHWLLKQLRQGAGVVCDGEACAILARSLTQILRHALARDSVYEKADTSYIRLKVTVVASAMTSRPDLIAAWNLYLRTLTDAVADDTLVASVWSPIGEEHLLMVLDEVANAWAMITLGWWPKEMLLPESEAVAEASAEHAAVAGDTDIADAAVTSSIHSFSPMAVVNMAGSALARIQRKLFKPKLSAACDAVREIDVEIQVDSDTVPAASGSTSI